MVRPNEIYDDYRHGDLQVVDQPSDGQVDVFYIPSPEKLELAALDPENALHFKVKLLEIDTLNNYFTILPINTLGGHIDFLKPKYDRIRRITLRHPTSVLTKAGGETGAFMEYKQSITFGPTTPIQDSVDEIRIADRLFSDGEVLEILESLPSGFTKDYDYGLGLAKPYRFIIHAIEGLSNCSEIVIDRSCTTYVDVSASIFYISTADFEEARKLLDRTTAANQAAGRTVKDAETFNLFAVKLGLPEKPIEIGRSNLRKLFSSTLLDKGDKLSEDEQVEVIDVMTKNLKSMSTENSAKIAKLSGDIELVNLENLIYKFECMLAKSHAESEWHDFFDLNPFILGQAFGYPIIKVRDKATMGGRNISGRGDKIADFLLKNNMTNNTAIVEIKTPSEKLLNKSEFRDGVYTPSSVLSGSINQVLDQKYKFEKEISIIKDNSNISDIASYSVHCCLIIGLMPKDKERQKSFELFRKNSKNVDIITFDELLEKLMNLKEFLQLV